MKVHQLKIEPQWYDQVVAGAKKAEIRKNDRDFRQGDWLEMRRFAAGEYRCPDGKPVVLDDADPVLAQIVGVVASTHLRTGYVMLSIASVGHYPIFEIRLPRPVCSIKNRRDLGTKAKVTKKGVKRVPITRKSTEMLRDMEMVRSHARLELSRRGGKMFGPEDAVRVELLHLMEPDEILVRAMRVGQIPGYGAGRGDHTKRDVHGMIETVADALNKVWYDDDKLVDFFSAERVR